LLDARTNAGFLGVRGLIGFWRLTPGTYEWKEKAFKQAKLSFHELKLG
jgi:hypothetical protein